MSGSGVLGDLSVSPTEEPTGDTAQWQTWNEQWQSGEWSGQPINESPQPAAPDRRHWQQFVEWTEAGQFQQALGNFWAICDWYLQQRPADTFLPEDRDEGMTLH